VYCGSWCNSWLRGWSARLLASRPFDSLVINRAASLGNDFLCEFEVYLKEFLARFATAMASKLMENALFCPTTVLRSVFEDAPKLCGRAGIGIAI